MAVAKQRRAAALSGRRIDVTGARPPYFPLERVPFVARSIEALFVEEGVGQLVCSAACGADLIALEIAVRCHIDRRIVLPFEVDRFRATSVNDRPGSWGHVFDAVLAATDPQRVIVMPPVHGDEEAYELTAIELVNLARRIGGVDAPLAIGVWEGIPKGPNDVTALFVSHARMAKMPVKQVAILGYD